MLKGFFRFIASFIMYFFEEVADQGKLNARREPTITGTHTPIADENNLPTIHMD